MAITLTCRDLGSDCDETVSGNSVDDVIAEMGLHAIAVHDYTEEMLQEPDRIELWRGAIKQSSRPPEQRNIKLDI